MPRLRCATIGACAATWLFCAAAPTAAAPAARLVYLRNIGAESCPDEATLRVAVAARLGYDPFFASAAQTMFAEITKDGSGFQARIKLVDESNLVRGTRALTQAGTDCAPLIDMMALSMSIAIDPQSLTRPSPTAPLAPASPIDAPSNALPAADELPLVVSARNPAAPQALPARTASMNAVLIKPGPKLRVDVGLAVAGWLGAAPALNAGGILSLRAQYTHYSIAVEARGDLAAERTVAVGRVTTSLFVASLVPCAHASWFAVCGVAGLGRLKASSLGVTTPRTDAALHVATGLRTAAEVWLGPGLAIGTDVSVLYTLTPQELQVNGAPVYTLPRVSLGVGAGVVWRLR